MRYSSKVPYLLVLIVLASDLCFGQKLESDRARCPLCKNTGRLVNPVYEQYSHLEEGVKFCSWIMEKDKKGWGIPWLPCEKCRNPSVKAKAMAEFEKLVAERKAWLEARREIDKFLRVRKPLLHIETEHFIWAWSIPKFSVDSWDPKKNTKVSKTYRDHNGLHLYADRMEDFYSQYQDVHKVTDLDNFNNLHQLFCFERQTTARKACSKYGEQAADGGKVTKQTKPSVFVTWWNKTLMPSDEDFHRDLIHNVAHLLIASYKTWWWLYEAGWAYEGHAHWWEIYYYKKATSHCYREVNRLGNWVSSKWESKVKKMVLAKKNPSIADILPKPGDAFDAKEHTVVWSYVDFMMSMDPRKTVDCFDILKQKKPAREAFQTIWGMSPLSFEEKWIEYVKSNYQLQDDSIPLRRRR